ncbi:MAG: omptin family outer membrane protease [Candidatus Electrothrix sp. GW3-4]|uniref:omptin family outer membrane protease n=1 Tax=Candidatus Electrothrix sp. GW3-4 TaxID=3126740 RepID=UPI0030CD68D7
MKQAAKKKAIRKIRGLGVAFGLMGTGMLFNQAQAAAYVDPYITSMIDLSFGLEEVSGDMTSSIGGEINHANGQNENTFFPISELKWPMDILLARFDGSLTLNPMWRINGTLKTAVDDPDETMIDRDWFASGGPADIYSESSISEFEAFILDLDFEWTYLQQGPWSLSAGIGYLYQDFEYEGNLIMQYSPTGISGYTYVGNGSTGVTYENTFSMIYFLLAADVQLTSQFELAGKFSVAPLASSEDELHHLYYNKVSTGDMDGTAYMFEVSGTFQISPWWFVEAGVQLTDISVDGDQYQVLAGEPLGQIDQEVESDQGSVYITMGYSF